MNEEGRGSRTEAQAWNGRNRYATEPAGSLNCVKEAFFRQCSGLE